MGMAKTEREHKKIVMTQRHESYLRGKKIRKVQRKEQKMAVPIIR